MKIPIIKTGNTTMKQLRKIYDEFNELVTEHNKNHMYEYSTKISKEHEHNMKHESLDLLTATLNLIHMLNIDDETIQEWQEKMIGYEMSKGYKILKWLEIEEEKE